MPSKTVTSNRTRKPKTSKRKQSEPYDGRPLDLRDETSDSESDFTPAVQSLIENKPENDAALPVVSKFLDRCDGFVRRGSHDCFLVAWNAGEILSAIRQRCVHGNSKAAKSGEKSTFKDVVEAHFTICEETANRWADLFDYVKTDVTNWNRLSAKP